ncbi:hypothetical protein [Salisediminibacterium beveridgei]|uniref:Uncharacterized protein n=1 Tax=Salisediminibacterium beveridgei TaxID=632773 RepID=A0A1D7QSS9_9BACI|nr:hypothetical protein [Salisediminibacterium beveridgei]AOM82063.1 hypothetical protein BBEV_0691 [Salisediminibacterium beveridgei]
MIHTLQMYVPMAIDDVERMKARFHISGDDVESVFHGKYPFAHFNLINQQAKGRYYLSMHIDIVKILGRSDIDESDFTAVERQINSMIFKIFMDWRAIQNAFLVRIDYRYDIQITDPNQRKLLFHLYGKLAQQHGHLKKHTGKLKSDGTYEAYETSVYHSSKSSGTLVYDKEAHLADIGLEVMPYEESVLRFEVKLSKAHLDYKMNPKKCLNTRDRQLKEYFKRSVFHEYMYRMLKPIYFQGDFVKLTEAKKRIERSTLTPYQKDKLIDLLKKINYSKATVSSPVKKGNVSKPTFKKYLRLLEELSIHPITIPKNIKGSPKSIPNPLSLLFDEIEKSHPIR